MRQFYGRLEKIRSFCRKTHVRKIPRFRGGGEVGILGFGGGGGRECRFHFYGRADFSENWRVPNPLVPTLGWLKEPSVQSDCWGLTRVSNVKGKCQLEEGKRPPPPRQESASGLY